MASRAEKIHGIIHTAALAAAAVGGGLAQAPGSDAAVIAPIQASMIAAVGVEHGVQLSKGAAAELILPFSAAVAGAGAEPGAARLAAGAGQPAQCRHRRRHHRGHRLGRRCVLRGGAGRSGPVARWQVNDATGMARQGRPGAPATAFVFLVEGREADHERVKGQHKEDHAPCRELRRLLEAFPAVS